MTTENRNLVQFEPERLNRRISKLQLEPVCDNFLAKMPVPIVSFPSKGRAATTYL